MGDADILGLLDPLTIGLVLGGSLLVAAIRSSRGEVQAAFAALAPLVRADPAADAEAAAAAVLRIEAIAEAKSIVCADRVATAGRFLTEATRRLSDARTADGFARWAEEALSRRAARHAGAASFWQGVAETAPALGMIATVLGLVRMFTRMADPAAIGPPMASALVATFAGLVIANLLAGPVADRLERLSAAELAWQRRTLDHLVALAEAELSAPPAPDARSLQRRLARRYVA